MLSSTAVTPRHRDVDQSRGRAALDPKRAIRVAGSNVGPGPRIPPSGDMEIALPGLPFRFRPSPKHLFKGRGFLGIFLPDIFR
jgi:hypothetical protein